MRPPRYRFPDEVRSTTRAVASRMVREGAIARTPEELDAWISQAPEVRESLEKGGFGREFTSHDLFPLLEVFVAQAGGSTPSPEASPRRSGRPWLMGALVLVLVLLLLAVAIRAA